MFVAYRALVRLEILVGELVSLEVLDPAKAPPAPTNRTPQPAQALIGSTDHRIGSRWEREDVGGKR